MLIPFRIITYIAYPIACCFIFAADSRPIRADETNDVRPEFSLPKAPERPNHFKRSASATFLLNESKWLKLAEDGNTKAMFVVAQGYDITLTDSEDAIERARAELNQFRHLGDVPANALQLKDKIAALQTLVERCKPAREQWLQKAAESGHVEALEKLATVLFEDNRDDEAITWARKAAAMQSATAINLLGWAAEEGRGTAQDPRTAVMKYLEAAQKGNPVAMRNLARALIDGVGVKPDPVEAYQWYVKAGEQGVPEGWYIAGMIKYNGTGMKKDIAAALELLEKAGNAGVADAMYWYASIALDHKVYDKAIQWYAAGTRNGHAHSMTMAGICFYRGLGTEANRAVAKDLWRRAHEAGDPTAAKFYARAERQELLDFQDAATIEDIERGREFMRLKSIE